MPNPTTEAQAQTARLKILEMIHRAGTSHIASNFSVIDIATVLYANLNNDWQFDENGNYEGKVPEGVEYNIDGIAQFHGENSDVVVWSKGWAAATIYYFLAQNNEIPREALEQFPNPPYIALAETSVNGVHVSGGSMGHGLPVAVGMAFAKKRAGQKGIVYCIMSDGEMNEGTTWEAAALAAHHKLNNLCVIIDVNGWQAMGRTSEVVDYAPLFHKWIAFRWRVHDVGGHDHEMLKRAILHSGEYSDVINRGQPKVILANTIKGKGVSFFEDSLIFHYKHVDKETYEKAKKEIEAQQEAVPASSEVAASMVI